MKPISCCNFYNVASAEKGWILPHLIFVGDFFQFVFVKQMQVLKLISPKLHAKRKSNISPGATFRRQ